MDTKSARVHDWGSITLSVLVMVAGKPVAYERRR